MLGRLVTLAVSAAVVGGGLFVAFPDMAELRRAHLYRQASGEGLMFFWPAVSLIAGGVLTTAGSVGLAVSGCWNRGRARLAAWAIAAVAMSCLLGSAAVFVWVEAHGERCIGPCG